LKRPARKRRPVYQKQKICRFCSDSSLQIEYKDYATLRHFVTERGKIIPRRISGCCAKHQRELTRAIKRARSIAIIPFTVTSA